MVALHVWRVAVVLAAIHTSVDAGLFPGTTSPAYREPGTGSATTLTSSYQRYPSKPAPNLPLTNPLLRPRLGVQQVHITQGRSPGEVIIQWAENTTDASASAVKYRLANARNGGAGWKQARGLSEVYSSLNEYNDTTYGVYNKPYDWYTSPYLHYVTLSDLQPASEYEYTVPTDDTIRNFRTAPAPGSKSVTFGIIGDVGQTKYSVQTLKYMRSIRDELDMMLHMGDISYANGLGLRWDSYGRMAQFFAEGISMAMTGGNHEFEGTEEWVHYTARFKSNFRASESVSALWHSFETGPAHVISLCSYIDTAPSSAMGRWLLKDLQSIDRKRTPWLIVIFHTPWYTSNYAHLGEGETMRVHLESLLYDYGADLVMSGHVHAYERTYPVYNNTIDRCGPVYLTVGDGGNAEGLAGNWTEPQPAWSAFRESAYGGAALRIKDKTSAEWVWLRNDYGRFVHSDVVTFTRPENCPNRQY